MVKHFLLLGDLGSGVNLIKNILFTDDALLCPFNKKLVDKVYDNHNPADLSKTWLQSEYKTRNWHSYFGFDLSDHFSDGVIDLLAKIQQPTIFINHSCFHNESDRRWLLKHKEKFKVIGCLPLSKIGIEWQVRAYIAKKGISNLHNFSFFDNVEQSRLNYIATYGEEAYYKFNVLNFFEAVEQNNKVVQEFCTQHNFEILDTDNLYKGSFIELSSFGSIDIIKSKEIFNRWFKLHWDYNETKNWKYSYANCRT